MVDLGGRRVHDAAKRLRGLAGPAVVLHRRYPKAQKIIAERMSPIMKMAIIGMPVGRPNTVSPAIISMMKSHNAPPELRIDDNAVFSPQV